MQKPFKLPLVAGVELLLEGLPNLEVWGEFKPHARRLVVTRVEAVMLPPKQFVEPVVK